MKAIEQYFPVKLFSVLYNLAINSVSGEKPKL